MRRLLLLLFLLMAKPAAGTKLNTAHPLASGLIGAFVLNEGTGTAVGDQATGNASEGTLSGTTIPTWSGVNDQGLKFAGGAALASYVGLGSVAALQDLFLSVSKPGSIFIKGRIGTTNTAGGLVGRNDDNATTRGWNISLIAGAKIEFASEATANMYTTIAAPAANTDFDYLVTHDGSLTGANVVAYLNGSSVTVTVVANGTTPKTSDSADPLRFGTSTGFTSAGSYDGYLYEVLIYNRVLSAAEAASLHADPYQMFGGDAAAQQALVAKPLTLLMCRPLGCGNPLREVKYYDIPPALGGGVTLVLDVGTLQLDGFAPALGLPVTILPSTGQLSLTGLAPQFPTTVVPGSGALSLIGFGPSIGLPKTIVPGLGQLTLAGFSPAIGLPRTIVPATGALDLNGFAPTFARTIVPGFGALTLGGFAPSLTFVSGGFTAQPGLGALTLAGFSPAIGLPRTVQPGLGALVLSGNAPAIGLPITVRPAFGQLTLSGFGPSISFTPPGITLVPGTGQLTLTGYAPFIGTFTMRFAGGPVMVARITAGGVLVSSINGGPVLTGSMSGGPA